MRPLARASVLPNVRDQVFAYGYPTGGTSLSITKGIVSRIEGSDPDAPAHNTAMGGQPSGTCTLTLPTRRPAVAVPVVELFLA